MGAQRLRRPFRRGQRPEATSIQICCLGQDCSIQAVPGHVMMIYAPSRLPHPLPLASGSRVAGAPLAVLQAPDPQCPAPDAQFRASRWPVGCFCLTLSLRPAPGSGCPASSLVCPAAGCLSQILERPQSCPASGTEARPALPVPRRVIFSNGPALKGDVLPRGVRVVARIM